MDIPIINMATDVTKALTIISDSMGIAVPSNPYLNIVRKTATGFIVKYNSRYSSGILSNVHNTGDKKKRNVKIYLINNPTSEYVVCAQHSR